MAFVYFYVYAVNYIRGVRGDDELGEPKSLKNLPQFLDQFPSVSSREGRDAEALWPLAMRSGLPSQGSDEPPLIKKKLRVRKRPIKVEKGNLFLI